MIWLVLLLSCKFDSSGGHDVPVDLLTELAEPGPFSAGYRTSELTWTDADTGDRTLRLAIWYPTEETEGPDFKYLDLFAADGAVLDAEPAVGAFPVVVFSHGHLAYAEAASFWAVHLASHGWVVVAPDHSGNTTFDGPDRATEIYWQRPMDLSAVVDHLEDLPGTDPLAGYLRTSTLVLAGHSFGGYGVFANAGATYDLPGISAGCQEDPGDPICTDWPGQQERFTEGFFDPRFTGAIAMAAGDYDRFGAAGVGAVSLPVLMLTGGLDTGADNDVYWDALTGPDDRRVHLAHAAHNSFTDFAGILDNQPDLLDPDEGKKIIRSYVLAWARHLNTDASVDPVLDGELVVGEDAELLQH